MENQSYLDKKYFIDSEVYNCPFCNRRNVAYDLEDSFVFHWSTEKPCFGYLVKCMSCGHVSMHLSYSDIKKRGTYGSHLDADDIDSKIFYHQPTSFFVLDSRIPRLIRELITEAEGCLKMNFVTGGSACMRKAIYELTTREKAEGRTYEDKIKSLKAKFPAADPALFDALAHVQSVTSDKVHEQSWPKWDSKTLHAVIEVLKSILYEIYVLPVEKQERLSRVQALKQQISKDKKT